MRRSRRSSPCSSFLPRLTPPAVAQETIALAPVSAVTTASATAPIPRFAAVQVQNDCKLLGGCKAPVVLPPKLLLEATPIHISAVGGGGAMTSPAGSFKVHNTGSGNMDWSISVIYQGGHRLAGVRSNVWNQRSHVKVTANTKTLTAGVSR